MAHNKVTASDTLRADDSALPAYGTTCNSAHSNHGSADDDLRLERYQSAQNEKQQLSVSTIDEFTFITQFGFNYTRELTVHSSDVTHVVASGSSP